MGGNEVIHLAGDMRVGVSMMIMCVCVRQRGALHYSSITKKGLDQWTENFGEISVERQCQP